MNKNQIQIQNYHQEKILCSCGKLGQSKCIFNLCKKCCNIDKCTFHCSNPKNMITKKCIFCYADTPHSINNKYFCQICYNSYRKQIDNITPKKYMFEVISDICGCGHGAPNTCIFKFCRNCCPSKYCPRHNKEIDVLGMHNCCLCNKVVNINLMNNYYVKSMNKIINYCKKCYNTHRIFINKLIHKNATKEQIDNLKIKMIETDEEKMSNLLQEEQIKKEQEEEELLNKNLIEYKDTIFTNQTLIKLKKKNIKLYNKLLINKIKYKCPLCNIITENEICKCVECNKYICYNNCTEEKHEKTENYGNIGNYDYMETIYYCKDCFIDYNKLFYNKYKNKIVTDEIINKENVDIDEFIFLHYLIKFKCDFCDNVSYLTDENVKKCSECNKICCVECGTSFETYINTNDTDDNENIKTYKYFCCNNCNYTDDDSDDDSDDSDDNYLNDKDNTKIHETHNYNDSPVELATNKAEECNICYMNKKKYACVPCGHLCMCGECANKVNAKCPLCNIDYTDIIKIFI
jgi:hypothetical protein